MPKATRTELGWSAGDELALVIEGGKLLISPSSPPSPSTDNTDENRATCKIDALGRIALSAELRAKLALKAKDKLELNITDGGITATLATSYVPECVFCGTSKIKLIFNNKDICENCLELIYRVVG